ncbi:hypothetical protein A6F68_02854 [Tsuneonella dongtanensis]|uniref:Uncharacterized protein n=1 Tax=Tsuneonella dongtanensis TaxID=692370 RepID=A0A1B2AGR1_9SPHN|nr:hypothetical protein [Tsuneonella dongtanensis]ANY21343.1 hypothetical protein A6F68_02854 [Tsuneonella dongtanensis]
MRQALAYRAAIDRYVGKSDSRRLDAISMAETAKAGSPLPGDGASIRAALEKDLAGWASAFGFDKATIADQRVQWLAEKAPMAAADWAKRRADWYAARDAWLAEQKAWAEEQAGVGR